MSEIAEGIVALLDKVNEQEATIAEQAGAISRLRGSMEPFAEYARKREAARMLGMDDVIHAINPGHETEAEIKYSDCLKVAKLLEALHTESG